MTGGRPLIFFKKKDGSKHCFDHFFFIKKIDNWSNASCQPGQQVEIVHFNWVFTRAAGQPGFLTRLDKVFSFYFSSPGPGSQVEMRSWSGFYNHSLML